MGERDFDEARRANQAVRSLVENRLASAQRQEAIAPPPPTPDPAQLDQTAYMLECRAIGRAYFVEDRPASACIHSPTDAYVRWGDVFRLLGYIDAMALKLNAVARDASRSG